MASIKDELMKSWIRLEACFFAAYPLYKGHRPAEIPRGEFLA